MLHPQVSYIILTMNRQDVLVRCLKSVRAQEYPEKHVLVVDNHSTDETLTLLEQQFPEIDVIPLASNQGVAGGRNRGIEAAGGDICIFLDDDACFLDSRSTTVVVEYFQRDAKLGGVAFLIVNAPEGVEARSAIPRRDKRRLSQDYRCTYFCGAGFARRREVFDTVGYFWENLMYGGEELDFSYRLLRHGYTLLHSSAIPVLHREGPQIAYPAQWCYCNARNRVLIAVKHLPWRYVISASLLWWSYLMLRGLQHHHLRDVMQGIADALAEFPAVMRQRAPLPSLVLHDLKRFSGRLWH